MHTRLKSIFLCFSLLSSPVLAADMDVQLTTSNGSTKFSIQNAAASEVASVDSTGHATFSRVTVGSVSGTVLPSGTIILSTGTCPSGFSEFTAARGLYLVGVPAAGTVGGSVGSAMSDLANNGHSHTTTFGTAGNTNVTLGNQPRVTGITNPTSDVTRGAIAPYFQIRLCSVP